MSDYSYRAKIVRVVDADTVIAYIDLGFETTRTMRCRIYGINAPEMNTEEGVKAYEYARNWFAINCDKDGWLQVTSFKDRSDKYGRYLLEFFSARGMDYSCFSEDIIAANLAVPYKG